MAFPFCSCVRLQVLDKDVMLKLEKKVLFEVSTELSRLLEPVSDPDLRLKLLSNYAWVIQIPLCSSHFCTDVIGKKSPSSTAPIGGARIDHLPHTLCLLFGSLHHCKQHIFSGDIQPLYVVLGRWTILSRSSFLSPVVTLVLPSFWNFIERPDKLLQLADSPLDTPLWVQLGKPDELAEAELRYVGPLTRGNNAVLFGVELKVKLNLGPSTFFFFFHFYLLIVTFNRSFINTNRSTL